MLLLLLFCVWLACDWLTWFSALTGCCLLFDSLVAWLELLVVVVAAAAADSCALLEPVPVAALRLGLDEKAFVTAFRTVLAVALISLAKFLRAYGPKLVVEGGDSLMEKVAVFGDDASEFDEFDLDSLSDSMDMPG